MKTVIVLLDSDLTSSLRILGGVQDEFSRARDIRVAPVNYNQTDMLEHLLGAGGVDGVIGAFPGDRWLERLTHHVIPLVNIGSISEIKSIPSVTADYAATGALAARYLLEHGWYATAVVHERSVFASRQMREGFSSEAVALGATPAILPDGIITSDSIRLKSWLATLPDPVACFCTSDFLARQVANAFVEIGRTIPESAGILGVGDSLLDSVLSPRTLSTILLPDRQTGRSAAVMLLAMLDAPGLRPQSETLPPIRVIVRESTAIARYSDQLVNRAVAHISSNLFSVCGTEELARICGVSKRTLEMRFRAATGQPPAEEWRILRHREICRLLAETNIPVKEIAEMSGYAEPPNFWNAFKKAEGTTPAKYREARR